MGPLTGRNISIGFLGAGKLLFKKGKGCNYEAGMAFTQHTIQRCICICMCRVSYAKCEGSCKKKSQNVILDQFQFTIYYQTFKFSVKEIIAQD